MVTREDIEANGFVFTTKSLRTYYESNKQVRLSVYPGYDVNWWNLQHEEHSESRSGIILYGRKYRHEDWEKFYEGKCRNKEEFEYILKLIGYLEE